MNRAADVVCQMNTMLDRIVNAQRYNVQLDNKLIAIFCIKWDVIIKQIVFAHFRSFKSFRLKKKSSTLGINKTSESPPMLRRDDDAYNYNNSAANAHARHTIDVGLSNNFQRNTAYRSSLQNLDSRVSRYQLFS